MVNGYYMVNMKMVILWLIMMMMVNNDYWLVVLILPPLKNIVKKLVSWDDFN